MSIQSIKATSLNMSQCLIPVSAYNLEKLLKTECQVRGTHCKIQVHLTFAKLHGTTSYMEARSAQLYS